MGRVIVHLDSNPKDGSIASIIREYEERVRSRGISVQFSKKRDSNNYESELSDLPGHLVLLDERGISMTSEEMANWFHSAQLDSKTTNIAVGPPDGFSKEIRESANQMISLSSLTLTHEMAGALLMEQLYRASEISRGSAYHRN
ncbi:MAG TPA: 23S rRNA (pseudouridine(1915)-N(3))-methyltransferase RlmH [Candidatus Poseidoniales archaeon]|nr:MAG: 50S rRNA methyltransferase [Euryarchaeota archaeon]HIG34546.1 23S rRNA (pseudouridine(1915)-N(3))-methyltransferase RlmH [Candidatus Poseidoniales archaeon]HIL67948.1 23S rRNA (pseudouridine(1915)-N(3))-methyltransferase RlmH [Candidatus Poseidoniales archaeon]